MLSQSNLREEDDGLSHRRVHHHVQRLVRLNEVRVDPRHAGGDLGQQDRREIHTISYFTIILVEDIIVEE